MRAKEFIFETVIYESTFGGYDIQFTKHFLDRLAQRKISTALINNMLKRLDRVKKQINSIETQTSFNIYDRKQGVHIVISKPDENSNKLQLITAYKNNEYYGKNTVIPIR